MYVAEVGYHCAICRSSCICRTNPTKCNSPISHNAPFCNRNVHICAYFCYKVVHCGIFVWRMTQWDSWDKSIVKYSACWWQSYTCFYHISFEHSWFPTFSLIRWCHRDDRPDLVFNTSLCIDINPSGTENGIYYYVSTLSVDVPRHLSVDKWTFVCLLKNLLVEG